jgi:glutathionylspermidine synthase
MNLPASEPYLDFAKRLRGQGLIADAWLDGKPRFATAPVWLPEAELDAINRAAEGFAAAHDELVQRVLADDALLATYFRLGTAGRAMWDCAAPYWHGIARADVFATEAGPMICELNADTPSGQAEAITLSQLFAAAPGRDPNAELEDRFCRLVAFAGQRLEKPLRDLSVGILYPTELSEDLCLVALYERWLSVRGARVVLGSPYNLTPRSDGGAALLGEPCDVFLRHYKTDWWAEREPVWLDEAPFPDAEPLAGPLGLLLAAEMAGKAAVLNPFGAIVPQNKRSLALLWEERVRFSDESRDAIERFLPPTFRLETLAADNLRREREDWVLKSDYGCEGEETIVGQAVSQEIWEASIEQAVPGRWIAQQRFSPRRDEQGRQCNWGVYLVAGAAAGLYARLSQGPTDVTALSAAARIVEA